MNLKTTGILATFPVSEHHTIVIVWVPIATYLLAALTDRLTHKLAGPTDSIMNNSGILETGN